MSIQPPVLDDAMECPLCLGKGHLRRVEVLERLGMKDFARVAQLSAEETFRLLLNKHKQDEDSAWLRFEAELSKRINEISERHKVETQKLTGEKNGLEVRLKGFLENQETLLTITKDSERLAAEKQLNKQISTLDGRIKELEVATKLADETKALEIKGVRAELENALKSEKSENKDLNRKVGDYFQEISALRTKNQELQTELSKLVRTGKREEMDFAAEACTWPGVHVSDKLSKHGDYILAYRDAAGTAVEPRMVVDNKDKASITDGDIDKLIRDAKEHAVPVALLVTRDESQLRQLDKERRWTCKDGIWVLRTTRQWLPRDLDVLKPIFERMRTEGPEFLQKNVSLAEGIRSTLVEMDGIDKELKKASTAIKSASDLVIKYKGRLQLLCDNVSAPKIPPQSVRNVVNPGKAGSSST